MHKTYLALPLLSISMLKKQFPDAKIICVNKKEAIDQIRLAKFTLIKIDLGFPDLAKSLVKI
ncbi:hypothetical protein KKB40_01245 [Patescibacteria group bacterium]|nr:hypothetical protein [Patescibacteria group bacterium]